jgi:hypothetical protein
MGFLRRLLGGTDQRHADGTDAGGPSGAAATDSRTPAPDPEADERAYELALLREEQARLDEFVQRQQRYAAYAWQPPAEGGTRRADDGDGEASSG